MIIIGAGGFAKELLFVLEEETNLKFYDNINLLTNNLFLKQFEVYSEETQVLNHFKNSDNRFVVGIANPVLKEMLEKKFIYLGGQLISVIAKNAKIGRYYNSIGKGVAIMSNVIIETNNIIGNGCLIHNGTFISHDVKIGNYTEISPSVNLLGNVSIGNYCRIGTSATILPNITIGDNVIVGAGAVVTKNIPNNSTFVGVPAKQIK